MAKRARSVEEFGRPVDAKPRARFDSIRPSAAKRLYGRKWREESKRWLREQVSRVLCAKCSTPERPVPAEDVDHIEPHRGDVVKFWDRRNWQGLCKTCHGRKTRRGE